MSIHHTLIIERRYVTDVDVEGFLKTITEFVATHGQYPVISFEGYEDDERGLWEIEEVVTFFFELAMLLRPHRKLDVFYSLLRAETQWLKDANCPISPFLLMIMFAVMQREGLCKMEKSIDVPGQCKVKTLASPESSIFYDWWSGGVH